MSLENRRSVSRSAPRSPEMWLKRPSLYKSICLISVNSVCSAATSKNRLNEKPGTVDARISTSNRDVSYAFWSSSSIIISTSARFFFRLNRSHEELTPISWRDYFEHKRIVDLDGNKFTTYSLGNTESVLIVLLHGGGFNALTWSLFAVSIS